VRPLHRCHQGVGVEAAARSIAPVMGKQSHVLTIQNGLGSGERIAQFMPTGNVLLGVADGFGASMKGPDMLTTTQ
jgi:2-dehydropantoate 2-reductase